MRVKGLAQAMGAFLVIGAAPPTRPTTVNWLASYVVPQGDPAATPSLSDVTIRQVIRFQASGSSVRVVLGNQRGRDAIRADHLRLALLDTAGQVVPGSDRPITFATRTAVALAAGASLTSDPVALVVARGQVATITAYYPRQAGHRVNYVPEAYRAGGDHSADATPITSDPGGGLRGIVQRVDVRPTTADQVLVAIGDSITAGFDSTPFAHRSYPDQLTDRFATLAGGDRWSIVNAGISGNRVLHDDNGPCLVSRFKNDALDVPGVKAVLVLEGVNDIGHPAEKRNVARPQAVTADQIKSAYRTLIKQAHSRGVRIYFGTILPYGAAGYYSAAGEAIRQDLNAWIRTNKEADGFVAFAPSLLDPGSNPQRLRSDRTPDGLHPNDAGYGIMAAQVSPALIERSASTQAVAASVPATQTCLTD